MARTATAGKMGGGWLPQDRAERIGFIVSGAAHGALILWALLGGIFFTPEPNPPVATAEVSLMSSEEFADLQARAPKAPTESPAQPSVPEAASETPPAPEAETQPEAEPQPVPEEQTQPDAAPDVTELSPVETEVTDAQIGPCGGHDLLQSHRAGRRDRPHVASAFDAHDGAYPVLGNAEALRGLGDECGVGSDARGALGGHRLRIRIGAKRCGKQKAGKEKEDCAPGGV